MRVVEKGYSLGRVGELVRQQDTVLVVCKALLATEIGELRARRIWGTYFLFLVFSDGRRAFTSVTPIAAGKLS